MKPIRHGSHLPVQIIREDFPKCKCLYHVPMLSDTARVLLGELSQREGENRAVVLGFEDFGEAMYFYNRLPKHKR